MFDLKLLLLIIVVLTFLLVHLHNNNLPKKKIEPSINKISGEKCKRKVKEGYAMQKVLFCKIAWMNEYQGITENDRPINGGSYISETADAWEKYNFMPVNYNGRKICFGFVETKHFNTKIRNGKNSRKQLHVENIIGCEGAKKSESVDGVLVIWCALNMFKEPRVVGWYKNATVFRHEHEIPENVQKFYWERSKKLRTKELTDCTLYYSEDHKDVYFVRANADDVTLLPHTERDEKWKCFTAKRDDFGFGQSMVWYGKVKRIDKILPNQVKTLIRQIVEHDKSKVKMIEV